MSKKTISSKYLSRLRNIGIIAHIDAGKTTLTERILYYTHKIHRMGEVHDGNTTMDYLPEEQERGITISSACTTCLWNGWTINLVDTPGHVDFTIEVERCLRVLDGVVGVFCAVGGVEPQSETVWRQSEKFHIPKLAFVNKMDRPGADFAAVLQAMRTRLGASPLPVQVPLGQGADFRGVVDLLSMEGLRFDVESKGEQFERFSLSQAEREHVEPWREQLLEAVAEEDDGVMEAYLSGAEIGRPVLEEAIRRICQRRCGVPVYAGSALKNIGVQPLLDGICTFLPSPLEAEPTQGVEPETKKKRELTPSPEGPLAALAFKVTMETGRKVVLLRLYSGMLTAGESVYNVTQGVEERAARLFRLHADHKEKADEALAGEIVAAAGMKSTRTGDTLTTRDAQVLLESIAAYKPVISLAIEPRNTEEGEKLDEALGKFLMEDPTLFLELDEGTGQRILSGMGELHLEVSMDRLKREYGLAPRAGNPQVVYRETVAAECEAVGEFDRELAEKPNHGWVRLQVESMHREAGTDIVFEVDPEAWSEAFLQAVSEGVSDSLQSGILKGYPVQDVRVRIRQLQRIEGKSTPIGFHMAAVSAMKSALAGAKPMLLEPIMQIEVTVPDDFVGEAISLLGVKGAKVGNMFDRAGLKVVQALAPMQRLFGFSTALRSATQGRAGLTIQFDRFDILQ